MEIVLKDLGFRRFNLMQQIIEEAFEAGISIYPGAWGTPDPRIKF